MSAGKKTKPLNLAHAGQDLRHTLIQARLFDEIWWLLEGEHPERATIVKASNQYLKFFVALRPGMFLAFIVALGSLFDERDDCITLKSIPEIAADPSFQDLWRRGRRLYRYRSKSIAHRDVRNETTDFAAATGFTYNQLRAILADACTVYERYARAKSIEPLPSASFSASTDLLRLMKKLVA